MDRVLIDSDVILDFFFDRKPFSDDAAKILALCESKNILGYLTPVIISNIYYLLRKTATHQKVISELKQLLTIIDILMIDKEVIENALNSEFRDFEDALQNYSAIKTGKINVIITRNIKDYKKSEIAVLTPENYIISRLI
jgi:predicted nucleic acid-binding protein